MSLNELMFRAGVYTTGWANLTSLIDEGLPIAQTVPAKQTVTHNVYKSDLRSVYIPKNISGTC